MPQRAPVLVQPPSVSRAAPATPASAAGRAEQPPAAGLNPIYLPQQVAYSGGHAPGTIVIDTSQKFLYLVGRDGEARRYGVGVGKEGFTWKGSERITRKAEWPDWRPPAQMIAREKAKGRILPAHMAGGPENPLGARALYLGSTLYRIHGTNQPWTIGQAVSSGCIRMRNEDVMDLYDRVPVGARVVVM
jgi:lipoprotein-anchoring transpeptidase ErfK/SrfK